MNSDAAFAGGPLSTALTLLVVGLLPLAFVGLTAFVKISTVLTIARAAIGAQGVPSNVVVLALAAALSMVAMAPVGTAIGERVAPVLETPDAKEPAVLGRLAEAVADPLGRFLFANSSERERDRFFELARKARPEAQRDEVRRNAFIVVVPAFLVTELIEAFALGFAIFLPFLVIDFVVANVLVALGAQALGPSQVSLPFKLLLFVAADGWGLLAEALVTGYLTG
jgi:type III secretion protein R